jgi:putative transposase
MRKSQFTDTQIAGFLQEHAAGGNTTALCRRIGVTPQTLSRWKKQYGGVNSAELTRLKALEAENARLKRLVADQALDNVMLKDLLGKQW